MAIGNVQNVRDTIFQEGRAVLNVVLPEMEAEATTELPHQKDLLEMVTGTAPIADV